MIVIDVIGKVVGRRGAPVGAADARRQLLSLGGILVGVAACRIVFAFRKRARGARRSTCVNPERGGPVGGQ